MHKNDGAFNRMVGCFSIVGVVFTIFSVIIGIVGLFYQRPLRIFVQHLLSTPTPVVITMPTPEPLPTYTPYPTQTPAIIVATATPLPTPEPNVLFFDNFDTGVQPDWQAVSGRFLVVNGELTPAEAPANGNRKIHAASLVGDPSWSNYIIEADAHGLQESDYCRVYILVRAQDWDNLIAFKVSGNCAQWCVQENGEWKDIPGTETQESRKNTRIKVVIEGNKYTAYLNGTQKASFIGDIFLQGRVGIYIRNEYPKKNNPTIDNFKVTKLD